MKRWGEWSYWLRYGLIFGAIYIVFVAGYYGFVFLAIQTGEIPGGLIIPALVFWILNAASFAILGDLPTTTPTKIILFQITFYFILGAIIGWLYGLRFKKAQNIR